MKKTKEEEMYDAGYKCATATALEFLDNLFRVKPPVWQDDWEDVYRDRLIEHLNK